MELKILFTGQVGAGKTTAIQTISDIATVATEATASDQVAEQKATTTVAMDYGQLILGDGQKVHLYGTPGQKRFQFMWDILSRGGLGLIILVDNSRPKPVDDLLFYLNAFDQFIRRQSVAIGITRMDQKSVPRLIDYQQVLDNLQLAVPLFEIDARRENDVKTLLQSLLCNLQYGVH